MAHCTEDGIIHSEDSHSLVKSDSHTVKGSISDDHCFPVRCFDCLHGYFQLRKQIPGGHGTENTETHLLS